MLVPLRSLLFLLTLTVFASAGVVAIVDDDVAVDVVRVDAEPGGGFLELRTAGVDFTPQRLATTADGRILIGGACVVKERNGERSGFGILKLNAAGAPDLAFGKKFGAGRVGLAFIPMPKDCQLTDVAGMLIQPGKPGREKVILVGNAQPIGGSRCFVAARVAVKDGKPSKLGGALALLLGFGPGLEGASRVCALGVDETTITIGGDWNGHPAFLRLDGKTGKLHGAFGDGGKRIVEVQSFATASYDHTTALDSFVLEPSGRVFAIGRLLAADRATKAFQILIATHADGSVDQGFGLPTVDSGGATRVGATTSFYELPVEGGIATDLSMHSAVVARAGVVDGAATEKLFVGLGTFHAPGSPPLCAINLIRLVPDEAELTGEVGWRLATEIFAVNPAGVDPRDTPFEPAALLRQMDGELVTVVTDAAGHVFASQHNVLDEFYPDDVRDLRPMIDGERRQDLFYGIAPPAAGADVRILATLQSGDAREFLIVARIIDGEATVLRRFNTNNGALDEAW